MQDIFYPHGDHLPLPFYVWIGSIGSESLKPGMFINIDKKVCHVCISPTNPKTHVQIISKSADGTVHKREILRGDVVQIYEPSYVKPLNMDWETDSNEDPVEDYWDYKMARYIK